MTKPIACSREAVIERFIIVHAAHVAGDAANLALEPALPIARRPYVPNDTAWIRHAKSENRPRARGPEIPITTVPLPNVKMRRLQM
jgi:hypothetical protein